MLQCFYLAELCIYYINNTKIEEIDDPGRTSLIKGLLSYSSNKSKQNSFGWILDN